MLFMLILSASIIVDSTPCTDTYQCAQVSADFNYVDCINQTCQCKTEFGFSGEATASSICYCPSSIYWGNDNLPYCINCEFPAEIEYDNNGIPRCINIAKCASSIAQLNHQKNMIRELYTNLIFPKPFIIMQNPSLIAGLFSPNVSGRITPVGAFTDLEGTVEYFYALAAGTGGAVADVNFIDLISEGTTVTSRVDIFFNESDISGHKEYNLTQTGFFHFDCEGRIMEYDLAILRLGDYADAATANHSLYIEFVCQAASLYCNVSSPYLAYSNFQSCYQYLSSIPFGSWNNARSNTVVCRILHSILVPFRPQVHCPHVGPTGGHACVDSAYGDWYLEGFY